MNFSFEGNFKPKRNINLGGVKSNDDKRSLMAKAQAERKAREQDRLKLKSAQQIQVTLTFVTSFMIVILTLYCRLFIEDVLKLLSIEKSCD
jgi:hypothetical protein